MDKAKYDDVLKEIYAVAPSAKTVHKVEVDEYGTYHFLDKDGKIMCICGQSFIDAIEREYGHD